MADSDLNSFRGVGESSRIEFDIEKLRELGWMINRRESLCNGKMKVFFTYVSPSGLTFKSAKSVVEALKHEGVYGRVLKEENRVEETRTEGFEGHVFLDQSDDSDEDYEPPQKSAKQLENDE